MIAAVILNHNKPENADKLFNGLNGVFDLVEIWDSGSDAGKIPLNVTESLGNIYWAGAWRRIIERYSDYEAVWMLGCDIELQSLPEEYLMTLRQSLPFGCWSPAIDGRAHPFMLAEHYRHGDPKQVRNIEGMAMALSGEMMRQLGDIPDSKFGFGLDYWFCHRSRKLGLKNVIDGRVKVHHPPGIGYNESEAHDEMDKIFGDLYGNDYRRTIFEYDQNYEGNLMAEPQQMKTDDILTIITVDNGWGIDDFVSVVDNFPNVSRIIMQKGASSLDYLAEKGIQVIPYFEDLNELIRVADIALFTRVGPANESEYRQIVNAGVPTVVFANHSQGLIKHEEDGYVFGNLSWAESWVRNLVNNADVRERIRASRNITEREYIAEQETSLTESVEVKDENVPVREDAPLVTVITPTYHRDLKVIRRSMDCLKLQQTESWEQLICSNGEEEPIVQNLVDSYEDNRISYHWCEAPKGDYGNYARKAMLEKARGKYVYFFDDDNVILPDFLSVMVTSLEESGADVAVCRIMHFGPLNEEVKGRPPVVLTGLPVKLYHIDPLQVLVRRTVMQEIGWDIESGYISDGVTLEKLAGRPTVEVPMVLGVHI